MFENTDLRIFLPIFIYQNLSIRFLFFFFPVEPFMIASLTFHEVLVQWVSLFISSPFLFLCDCLRLPTSHLRTHLCHWRNSHEQEKGSASPKQKQHLLRVELHGSFLGAVGLSMSCPPQMVYPKVSCCKASGIALAEQWLSRTSSCVSWINLAKLLRVL